MDKIKDDLNAAHDYRGQLQEEGREKLEEFNSAIKSKLDAAFAHCREMFPDAELNAFEKEISAQLKSDRPLETPLDEPLSASLMDTYRHTVENAIVKLGYNLRSGVSAGFIHSSGLDAKHQLVMMTEASVVLVSKNLMLLINRLAKLIANSFPITVHPDNKYELRADFEEIKEHLHNNRELQFQWDSFFLDYALDPEANHHGGVFKVFGEQRKSLWGDLNEAMFIYVMGHEYGHHLAVHSLDGEASICGEPEEKRHIKELEADCFAAHICIESVSNSEAENVFLNSISGGAALLTALELIYIGKFLLEHGEYLKDKIQRSHPSLELRLRAIAYMTERYAKDNYSSHMQSLFSTLIEYIWIHSSKYVIKQHKAGLRPLHRDSGGWLPW